MDSPTRLRADLDVRARLQRAAEEVCAAVPEVEAVGFVVTWKFPVQPLVNPGLVFGAEGDLVHLGGLMRMGREQLRLLEHTNAEIRRLVLVQEELANSLAKTIYGQAAQIGTRGGQEGGSEAAAQAAPPEGMERPAG